MRSLEPTSLMPGQGTRRLFIGLTAAPAARAVVDDYRSMWRWPIGARLSPLAHLHITLHFLGEVPEAIEEMLRDALHQVGVPPLTLELQQAGIWDGGIAVLHVQADSGLTKLRERISHVLRRLSLPVDPRPSVPHVTLARNADGAQWPQLLAPIHWTASAVSLVWSLGGTYQVL